MNQKLIIDGLFSNDERHIAASIKRNPYLCLRLCTEVLEGQPLVFNNALKAICDALDKVISGDIKRLIINVPPGYGKTLAGVWSFVVRGFVVNPKSRFIHTSYSQELVLDNSSKIKEILLSEEFQFFNPLQLRDDTKAKGLWRTEQGGGMRAVQAGGGMTGFRAGQMSSGFSGAFIVDDPIKPDDSNSKNKLKTINQRYNGTIASRLAHEEIPVIVIMQRLASNPSTDDLKTCGDMSEFLLRGGSGEIWDHLLLPVIISKSNYPKFWTHGRPIAHSIPDGMLWAYKHTDKDAQRLKKADKYTFSAQYMQKPIKRTGGKIFDASCFGYYSKYPILTKIIICSDTANKTGTRHDYSAFVCAGLGADKRIYILDVLRGKWKSPELIKSGGLFWNKHKRNHGDNRVGASHFYIEDAQSGTGLIQHLQKKISNIKGISRNKDKFTRANGVLPVYSDGIIMLPSKPISDGNGKLITDARWVSDYVTEHEEFTDNDTHDNDDQIDPTIDVVEIFKFKKNNSYEQFS